MKHKLIALLLLHQEDFIHTVMKRQFTSIGNKELHQEVLDALDQKNYSALYEALFYDFYFYKPLGGVIYSMNIEHAKKKEILSIYDIVKSEL
jgi:hypothetical protein